MFKKSSEKVKMKINSAPVEKNVNNRRKAGLGKHNIMQILWKNEYVHSR